MTLASYWPAPGLLVPFPTASDAPLSSSGAQAVPSDYLTGLVLQGKLLTSNPDDSGIPAPVDYFASAIYCTDLFTALGAFGGATVSAIGYRVRDDNGGGDFYWDATSVATADGGLVLGNAAVGRWIRLPSNGLKTVSVKWWGAYGDNSHDDTAAVQSAFNACVPYTSELLIPAGFYRITSTLVLDGSPGAAHPVQGIRVTGESGACGGNMATWLSWDGPGILQSGAGTTVGSTMLNVVGFDNIFKHILFYNGVNGQWSTKAMAYCGVALGNLSGASFYTTSHNIFEQCKWNGFRYAVMLDRDAVVAGNLEETRFIDCRWETHDTAVWIRGGQPFNTIFQRCQFSALDPTGASRIPYGRGVKYSNNQGGSIFISDVNFSYLTRAVQVDTNCPISISRIDSEAVKRLFEVPSFTAANTPFAISDGRADASSVINGLHGYMYTPAEDIAGTDRNYIYMVSGNLSLDALSFLNSYTEGLFSVYFRGECNVSARACVFPNATPFQRDNLVSATGTPGCTYSHGNQCTVIDPLNPAAPTSPCPQLNGAENPGGSVTISGAATTATVAFTLLEASTISPGTPSAFLYRVSLSTRVGTGSPTMSNAWVSAQTTGGFTINLASAPGVGTSVIINYELSR